MHYQGRIKTDFFSQGLGYHHILIMRLEVLQRCGHQIRVNPWTASYMYSCFKKQRVLKLGFKSTHFNKTQSLVGKMFMSLLPTGFISICNGIMAFSSCKITHFERSKISLTQCCYSQRFIGKIASPTGLGH